MSQPPGPPPGPPQGPPPYAPVPPPARRRRPRGWWFLAPAVALVAGATLVVLALVTVLGPLTQEDAVVATDGQPQVVDLPDAEPRLLMASDRVGIDPACEVRDPEGGEPLPLDDPGASYTYGDGSGSWSGFAVVDPLGTSIELTCTAAGGTGVRVVPEPGAGAFAGFAALLVSGIVLGLLGFLALVVLVVLYATGAPRRTTADGVASTDRSASGSDG